jgi:hypothetical protein
VSIDIPTLKVKGYVSLRHSEEINVELSKASPFIDQEKLKPAVEAFLAAYIDAVSFVDDDSGNP